MEIKEKMDGVVLIQEGKDFDITTGVLISDLRREGFEDVDIYKYLSDRIMEKLK